MKAKRTKHTLFLDEGQYANLAALHPDISVAEIIRRLIAAYLKQTGNMLRVPTDLVDVEINDE